MNKHFCKLSGFAISALVHLGLAAVLLPVLFAGEKKPAGSPILPLELSMFQPKAPETVSQPVPEVIAESVPPPAQPPPPNPKPKLPEKPKAQPEEKPKTKPEKSVDKLVPKPAEKPLPKPPERDLVKERREALEQQQQLEQARRAQALAEQRQREWEAQQLREHAAQEARQRREREAAAQAAAAQAQHSVPVITNPRYRTPPRPPEYPRLAQEAGIEGTVIVRVRVSASGNASDASVYQSSGNSLLDNAALKAVRDWAFVSATRNGQNIESIVQVPVHFKLD
ncbi:MAG: energy transducer TonB [Thiothrix sp.]